MCLKHFIGFKLKSYVHLIRGGSMNLDQALDQAEDFRLSGAYDQAKTSYDAIISLGHTKHIAHSHALRGLGEIYRMLENFEASEDSHIIAPISSLGLPNLFIGVWFKMFFFLLLSMKFFKFHSVGKKPGLSAFTLTLCIPHSLAKFFVRLDIPDFATEYA